MSFLNSIKNNSKKYETPFEGILNNWLNDEFIGLPTSEHSLKTLPAVNLIENNNNTVNLVYDIELGEKAMINKIVFLGNNNFKDSKLRKIIGLILRNLI